MTDRNLLFGILALQMDFITRDQLVAAMHGWVLNKVKPIGAVLVEQKALDAKTQAMLDAMVDRHVELHQGDPQKSLAALGSAGSAREALERIADGDVAASLVHVHAVRERIDPLATASLAEPAASGARFRILRSHARGGLGEVFVARDAELQRDVALKEIQPRHADDPVSRTRFALEAEITGGLEHPGIVPVYSLGHYADGRPFYAMRFIKGDSLMTAIEQYYKLHAESGHRAGPDVDPQFRQLMRRYYDVCNAIEYAHSRGVLHRDLKPGNIMLGKYGETLVVDWGLAKAMGTTGESAGPRSVEDEVPLVPASGSGSAETLPGSALGTPAYMSPEQALGRLDLLGPPSDVYSLGATLYCLLTGRAPFTDKVAADALTKVQRGEFPRPRQLRPGVPAPLEAICLKAMSVRPADRYASAAGLGRDVERWLDDAPVSAWPEPLSVKARRWMNRNRTLVTASAAAVLVAFVSLGITAFLLGSKNEELTQLNGDLLTANDAEKKAREDAVAKETEVRLLNVNLVKANAAETTAKNEALESEKLALHQSDVALKSLTSIVNQVQDELEDVPGTGEARKNLLNEALRLLRTVNSTPGNTTKLLAQRLVAHNQMGQIYWTQQRRREAEEQFKLSRELAMQALALEAKSDRARKDAAALTLKTADALIYYHGDPDAAVPLLHECLKLYEAMVVDLRKHPNGNPALPLAQRVALRDAERGLADTYDRFGEVASRANDLAKTADWLEKAKTIRQRLYDETDRADHQRRDAQVSILGQSIGLLANLRYTQGDLNAHLVGRKQVASLRREVAEHRPNSLRACGLLPRGTSAMPCCCREKPRRRWRAP